MSEYINRNELLKAIQSNVAEAHNERCAQILEAILNAPTADVVPKSELDLLKSTIAQKEEEAYNRGYAEAKADIFEKVGELVSDLAARGVDLDEFLGKFYALREECPKCKHFVGCEEAVWMGPCKQYDGGGTEE